MTVAFSASGATHPSAKSFSYTYPENYSDWQNSLLAGNGKTGIMVFGNPRSETIIFNARNFNFPGHKPRTFAEVPKDTLLKISKLCAESRFEEANALAVSSSEWNDGGEGGRHPGFVMDITMPGKGKIRDFKRECDFSTGEITVDWSDDAGKWQRRCFVSRDEDISAVHIDKLDGGTIDCTVSLRLPSEANYPAGMSATGYSSAANAIGVEVKYPAPSDGQGYSGLIIPKCTGGKMMVKNDTLFIIGAKQITLLGRLGKTGTDLSSCSQIEKSLKGHEMDY